MLFDTLNHPEADLGIENPSVVSWTKHSNKEVDHVILGKGVPGGCWQVCKYFYSNIFFSFGCNT